MWSVYCEVYKIIRKVIYKIFLIDIEEINTLKKKKKKNKRWSKIMNVR